MVLDDVADPGVADDEEEPPMCLAEDDAVVAEFRVALDQVRLIEERIVMIEWTATDGFCSGRYQELLSSDVTTAA